MAPETVRYGAAPEQFVRVWRPATTRGGAAPPVAVCIHGGYWRQKYSIDGALFETVAPDLAKRGFVAVDVEYRREGGWPRPNRDVLAALKLAGGLGDKSRIVVVGHSAGGQLALWVGDAAAKLREVEDPQFPVPQLVCAVAPVADLHLGFRLRISDDGQAIPAYMGGSPQERPIRYLAASPRALLPLRTRTLVTVGDADDQVPQSVPLSFVDAARKAGAGNDLLKVLRFPGADHFVLVNAGTKEWKRTARELEEAVGLAGAPAKL
eukprot:Hpha_TRINITY_DN27125_c0_g1::TRINITY_DN27125_c0_g1_i1::g.29322::m.29322